MTPPEPSAWQRASAAVAATWREAWFAPVDPRPLAAVRILAAGLGLVLLASFATDILAWFGPDGSLPVSVVAAWRPRFGWSLYDLCTSGNAVVAVFTGTVMVFVLLLLGAATAVTAPLAALLWASLLHRGPMLAGPADDCLAVILWCLAIGPAGTAWSLDRLVTGRGGAAGGSVRAAVAVRLLLVHAVVIAVAAAVSQAKADVWWDGTAAWWLAGRSESRLVDLTGLLARSEWLLDLVTHAVTLFEILFAVGLCLPATRAAVGRIGLVVWPLLGILAIEPWWGVALAILCVPPADLLPAIPTAASPAGPPPR